MTDELPPGWALVTVGDIAHFVRGVTYSKEHARNSAAPGFIPVLRATNIGDGLNYEDLVFVPDQFVSDEQIVNNGDIVLAMSSGSKSVVGKAAIAKSPPRCGFGAFCGVIRPSDAIEHSFLGYYFQTKAYRNAVSDVSKGSNINNLKAEHVLGRPLPIPPKAEQARIASKIDELFSRIDEGERALERVQKLVERYRQSVLKAAVTGELTRDWREKNKDKLESGEALLARILKARREAWEKAELDKMNAKGITPANDKWKQRYEEPTAPDTTGLPELPQGWSWASMSQVTTRITKGSSPKWQGFEYQSSGIRFVRSQNIGWGTLLMDDVAYLDPRFNDIEPKSVIQEGDLLLNIVGASIGRVAVATRDLVGGNTNQAVAGIRLVEPHLFGEFLMTYLLSPSCQNRILSSAVDVARANFNLNQIERLPVPVPPPDEILAIQDLVDAEDSRVLDARRSLEHFTRLSTALRQSALRSAFSGTLVEQCADDEPAAVLLERIAAERSGAPTKAPRGRKPKTSEPA